MCREHHNCPDEERFDGCRHGICSVNDFYDNTAEMGCSECNTDDGYF
jgi:hypothetical protein